MTKYGKISQRFDRIWLDLAKFDQIGQVGVFGKILQVAPKFGMMRQAATFCEILRDLVWLDLERHGETW